MNDYFDQVIERRGTSSVKWDLTETFLGYKDVLPFGVADMDFRSPPQVIDAVVRRAQVGVYGYTDRSDAFYEAIQHWFDRRHDWHVERGWISPNPGVVPSVHTAIRAYAHAGDKVVLLTPAYYPFFSAITENGLRLAESRLVCDGYAYSIDFDDLEKQLREAKLLIFCNPHNPVGRVWRRAELEKVAELCLRHGVLIVSDDIHCDLVLSERYTPIASIDDAVAKRTVTCLSPSKTFNLSGFQTSFVVIPDQELFAQFEREKHKTGYFFGNILGDVALTAAYLHGEPWLEALLPYLRANLDYLTGAFANHPGIRLIVPEGTYLAWLDFRPTGLPEEKVSQLLGEQAGVGLERGSIFGAAGTGFQRLNFATRRQILRQGVEQIMQVF